MLFHLEPYVILREKNILLFKNYENVTLFHGFFKEEKNCPF